MSRIEGLAVFGEPLFLLFYGLDYFAAFAGCSAETEASFDTIVFLAEKMDELGCGTIFTIENSDHKIAQTIIDNTKAKNQNIAEMNSLQSVSKDQIPPYKEASAFYFHSSLF